MRNFYTYKSENFTTNNNLNIEIPDKSIKKSVINWNDIYKIILVLILFAYFSVLSKEIYNFLQVIIKLIILVVILQTFFKDYPVIDNLSTIISKTIKLGTSLTKTIVNKTTKN